MQAVQNISSAEMASAFPRHLSIERQNPPIKPLILRHNPIRTEVFLCPRPGVRSHRPREPRRIGKTRQRAPHLFHRAEGIQKAAFAIKDYFRNPAHPKSHDWLSLKKRFQDTQPEAF